MNILTYIFVLSCILGSAAAGGRHNIPFNATFELASDLGEGNFFDIFNFVTNDDPTYVNTYAFSPIYI